MTDDTETSQEEITNHLDDVFDDSEDAEETSNEESEEADEEKGETEETEETSTEESEETEEEEKPSSEDESVPLKALLAERQKGQSARERAEQLESELKQLRDKYEPDDTAPDPIEDPEGYKNHLRSEWEREQYENNIQKSRNKAMEEHKDFEEMERTFLFMANQDPNLIREMNDSYDPAEFAYKKAKTYLKEERERLRKEILEEEAKKAVKEVDKEKETKEEVSATEVPDLTTATGSGSNSQKVETLEELDEMFEDSEL